MIKTIKINKNQSVTLNSAAGWFFVYRNQFQKDILPDILPAIEAILAGSLSLLKEIGVKDNYEVNDLVQGVDDSVLTDFFVNASGFEITTILQIVWAMAKCNDDSIEQPEAWFGKFETFPLDKVVPAVVKMIIESSTSAKNAKRLSNLVKVATGSLSNRSRSEELPEA